VAPSEFDGLISALNKVTSGDYRMRLAEVAATSTSNNTNNKGKKGKPAVKGSKK
jgi:hypothetical protein